MHFRSALCIAAHAVSAVNHQGVWTIHDIATYEGQPFIAMQLLRGRAFAHIVMAGLTRQRATA